MLRLLVKVCSFILSLLRKMMGTRLPKALVFDLDGCCWDPEMYELWGGGSPFKENKVARKNTVWVKSYSTYRMAPWVTKGELKFICSVMLETSCMSCTQTQSNHTSNQIDLVEFHNLSLQVEGKYSGHCFNLRWAQVGSGMSQEVPHRSRGKTCLWYLYMVDNLYLLPGGQSISYTWDKTQKMLCSTLSMKVAMEDVFRPDCCEIYKAYGKNEHINAIAKKTGIDIKVHNNIFRSNSQNELGGS